jgi:SAM-dependent methyltransferase
MTEPAPTHRDLILDQFTRQAMPFSTSPGIKDEAALALILEATEARRDDRALDVACGPGLVSCALARVVRHAVGVDLTPAMLARARAIQAERGLTNLSWCIGDVTPLPCSDASFSIVTSRYAFHHLQEPGAALVEMRRACRRGGRVALIDVMASADPAKAAAYDRMETLRDPSHVRALTLDEMKGLFRGVGLPDPRVTFYRLEADLDGVLARSFPVPGGAEAFRRIILDSLDEDRVGVAPHRVDGVVRFAYPIAILVADVP